MPIMNTNEHKKAPRAVPKDFTQAIGTPTPAPYYGGSYYESSTGNNAALMMHRFLSLLRRRWLTILLGLLFGIGASGYKLWTTPKIYVASSMIKMQPRRPRILQGDDAVLSDRYSWKGDILTKTRIEEFKGLGMMKEVVDYLKDIGDEFPMKISSAMFSPLKDSYLVAVTCRHTDPERAAISANAYAVVAEKVTFRKNKEESLKAVAWLQEQAVNQRVTLEEAADARIKFMGENKIDLLEHYSKIIKEQLVLLGSELAKIQSHSIMAKDLCDALDAVGDDINAIKRLPTDTPRSGVIHEKLSAMRRAFAECKVIQLKYQSKHPKYIVAIKKTIIAKDEALKALNGSRETAHANLKLQLNQIDSLETKIDEKQKKNASIELKLVKLKAKKDSLLRAEQALETTYRGLLRRIEEARLSADENTTSISVIKKATIPRRASSPNPRRIIMMGIMFGLAVGGGLAFLKEILDDPVTSTSDVEDSVDLRVLGLIPAQKKVTRAQIGKESLNKRTGLLAETFAGIHATLQSIQYCDHSKSLLVTSTAPGDGKTVVASDLAITFARHGSKTLLVDFDLRRPRIHEIFSEIEGATSLAEVLLNTSSDVTDFENLPKRSSCPNLDIVVAYSVDIEVSATEMVSSVIAENFINWAKANYDQVIIDSPPHGLLSDAGVLAGHVSGVLVVCWADKTRKQSLRRTVQQLTDVGANVIGVVINAVQRDFSSSYGRYDYYHKEYDSSRYG